MSPKLFWILPALAATGCLPTLEPVGDQGLPPGQYTCDQYVQEVGNEVVNLTILLTPSTFCGTLDSTGNDGTLYTGDRDNTLFRLDSGGPHLITLEWEQADSDYDLYLFRTTDSGDYAEVDASSGSSYPEQITASMEAGREYLTVVVGWSGPAAGWGVSVEPQ